jgi:porin
VVEAWYAHASADDRVRLKVGWQYANAEFGGVEAAGALLGASYGVVPTTPMPQYPTAALGASVWVLPARAVSCGVGVFRGAVDGMPADGSALTGRRPFTLVETKIEPFAPDARHYGAYRFGVWHQSGARFGLYATAEHAFRRNRNTGKPAGPGVFVQWGWAPADRNGATGYVGGGFVQRRPLRSRPDDAAGAGITSVAFAAGSRETSLELFYRLAITGRLSVQPDLQIVRHPLGEAGHAVAAGIRLEVGM